jgi:hypothetical protein
VATIHIQDQYHILETSRSIPGEQRNEFLREVARRLKQWRFPTSQQVDQFDLMEWRSALPKPFDPWADILHVDGEERHILGSVEFAGMSAASEVREGALVLLCPKLHTGSRRPAL